MAGAKDMNLNDPIKRIIPLSFSKRDNWCIHCEKNVLEVMKSFDKFHNVLSEDDEFFSLYSFHINSIITGFYDFLENPTKWVGNDRNPAWPICPELIANNEIYIRFVRVKFPFISIVKRIKCSNCSLVHRVINISVGFAYLLEKAQFFFSKKTVDCRLIFDFIKDNHAYCDNLHLHPAHPDTDSVLTCIGLAWVICHEVGHVAGRKWYKPKLNAPTHVLDTLVEELNSDMKAYEIIQHRLIANYPTSNKHLAYLPTAVKLVILTWNLLIPPIVRKASIEQYEDRIGGFTASPSARLKVISDMSGATEKIGLSVPSARNEMYLKHFVDVEEKTLKLWEAMDNYGVEF